MLPHLGCLVAPDLLLGTGEVTPCLLQFGGLGLIGCLRLGDGILGTLQGSSGLVQVVLGLLQGVGRLVDLVAVALSGSLGLRDLLGDLVLAIGEVIGGSRVDGSGSAHRPPTQSDDEGQCQALDPAMTPRHGDGTVLGISLGRSERGRFGRGKQPPHMTPFFPDMLTTQTLRYFFAAA